MFNTREIEIYGRLIASQIYSVTDLHLSLTQGSIGCRDVRLLSKEEGGIKELTNEKIEVYSEVVSRKPGDKDSKDKDDVKATTESKEAETKEEKTEEGSKEEDKEEEKKDEKKEESKEEQKDEDTSREAADEDVTKIDEKKEGSETKKEDAPETERCNGVSSDGTTPQEDSKGAATGKEKITILSREKDSTPSKSDEPKAKGSDEVSTKVATETAAADTSKKTQQVGIVPPPSATRRGREKPPAVPEFPEKEEVDSLATMLKRQQQDGRPLMPGE